MLDNCSSLHRRHRVPPEIITEAVWLVGVALMEMCGVG